MTKETNRFLSRCDFLIFSERLSKNLSFSEGGF